MKTTQFAILILALILACVGGLESCKNKKKTVPVNSEPITQVALPQHEIDQSQSTNSMPADTFLFYRRGACFGMCPIFNLTIYADGLAHYEGKNFVEHIGLYQTQIDKASMQKISATAEAIGYFGLENKYDNEGVTDLPTTTTGISKNGELKMVYNRYKGPRKLQTLYVELDSLIARLSWDPMKQ